MTTQTNPLEVLKPWFDDPTVAEIMVDGYENFYVERQGKFEDEPSPFHDNEHLIEFIRAVSEAYGRRVDESSPILDARLWDGSRFNAVIPPISLVGPVMVIRRFAAKPITVEDLLKYGSVSEPVLDFIRACVNGRLNIVISGGTGSGKTTLLRIISEFIPSDERIIVVENVTELRLQPNFKRLVRLESRPANIEGKGEVSIRDLVINALRMRPDRVIVGEVRAAEAIDVFQAMNTGHDGTMFSMHANGPRDALTRLEAMVAMANLSLPLLLVRQQMASAIQLIVHQERLQDGSRKVMKISEVTGMQGDVVDVRDIFEFRQTGVVDGRITGVFAATGYIPSFLQQMRGYGIEMPLSLFTPHGR
jgi:pilus assembly protein CpaF